MKFRVLVMVVAVVLASCTGDSPTSPSIPVPPSASPKAAIKESVRLTTAPPATTLRIGDSFPLEVAYTLPSEYYPVYVALSFQYKNKIGTTTGLTCALERRLVVEAEGVLSGRCVIDRFVSDPAYGVAGPARLNFWAQSGTGLFQPGDLVFSKEFETPYVIQ